MVINSSLSINPGRSDYGIRHEYFDLSGAIVQQVGGALNTAKLYRLATEGRRLAEEANRIKSRFLSTISHELRNPVNLIMGLSGILLEESDEGKSSSDISQKGHRTHLCLCPAPGRIDRRCS